MVAESVGLAFVFLTIIYVVLKRGPLRSLTICAFLLLVPFVVFLTLFNIGPVHGEAAGLILPLCFGSPLLTGILLLARYKGLRLSWKEGRWVKIGPLKIGPLKLIENHFAKAHLFVFFGIWLFFTLLTYWIAEHGIEQYDHGRLVFLTTCGTILGPMTGAISRDCQSCCLSFSLSLLPYCGAFLIVGAIPLFIRLPFKRGASFLRMALWIVGLLGWFLGGIFSFAHAFELTAPCSPSLPSSPTTPVPRSQSALHRRRHKRHRPRQRPGDGRDRRRDVPIAAVLPSARMATFPHLRRGDTKPPSAH